MKSFACLIVGIALIALVVPVAPLQYALAQNPGGTTKAQHICGSTQTPQVTVGSTVCDRTNASGHCETHMRYYVASTGTCVSNPAESISCYEWQEPWFVKYPIKYNAGYYTAAQWGLGALGNTICYATGLGIGAVTGVTPTGVIVGLIFAITCGAGVTYTVSNLDPCAWGSCSVNWSAGPTAGPYVKRCS